MKKFLLTALITIMTLFIIGCPDTFNTKESLNKDYFYLQHGIEIKSTTYKASNTCSKTYYFGYDLYSNSGEQIEVIETYENEGNVFEVNYNTNGLGFIHSLTELKWDITDDNNDKNGVTITIFVKIDGETYKLGTFFEHCSFIKKFELKEVNTLN